MCSRGLLVLGVSFASLACFDVEVVDSTHTVKIDDFEDRDQRADPESGFDAWYCHAWYDEEEVEEPCPAGAPGSGYRSEAAGVRTYDLRQLDNRATTGVLLGVSREQALSLRPFRVVRFSARLEEPAPRPPVATRVAIELVCPGALVGLPATKFPIIQYNNRENDLFGLELSRYWQTYRLPLAHFEEPWWQGSALDPERCIEQVEALQFVIAPDLTIQESAAGKLFVDDVYLE